MENSKIKVGIVGAGRMGITHYSILSAHPRVSVVAVADTTTAVNSLMEKYLGVRTYKDYAVLLEKEALDALLVCTPPQLNRGILTAAHRKRVHAFVEKPLATSHEDAVALVEMYESAALVNQVGYVNRFNDIFVHVKQLLDSGVLGSLIRFRSEMHSRTVIRESEESGWRAARATGGGAIFEMASHAIDLVNYLLGTPAHVVGTCLSQVFSKNVEDIVSSTFLYGSGLAGSLYVNWSDESYRKPTNKIEVFGTRGKLLADQYGLRVHLSAAHPERGLRAGWNSLQITDVFTPVPFYVRGIEFTAQLHHFIDCIEARGALQSRCSFRDAAATLCVIEQMFLDQERIAKEVS